MELKNHVVAVKTKKRSSLHMFSMLRYLAVKVLKRALGKKNQRELW